MVTLHNLRKNLFGISFALIGVFAFSIAQAENVPLLPPGHRPMPVGTHALVGAKVVVKPGTVLEEATVVIRNGRIEAAGADVKVPEDARVWDLKGQTVYAGFIDPYVTTGSIGAGAPTPAPAAVHSHETKTDVDLTAGINFFGVAGQERDPGTPGPGYEIVGISPEKRVAQSYAPDVRALEKFRELGFTAGNIVPEKGFVRGSSAFVIFSDTNPNRAILKSDVFQHVGLESGRGRDDGYPGSLMGAIAVVRQSFYDAQYYALDQADYRKNENRRDRPEYNPALEALGLCLDGKVPVLFEQESVLIQPRALALAKEMKLKMVLLATGQEWRRPDIAKANGAPFIVPLVFPEVPKMVDEDDWEQVTLDQLRAWDWAAENAALLRKQGLDVALTTTGLAEKNSFRKNLKLAIERGLSEEDALAALTTIPAKLCGVESRLGTIEAGKIANLTIVDGKGYFDPEGKVRGVWVEGRHYAGAASKAEPAKEAKKEEDKPAEAKESKPRVAQSPQEGRGPLAQPHSVLIKNATVWTSGPQGIIQGTDMLVVDGKIQAIGKNLSAPKNDETAFVFDAQGMHVTPGMIDAHSHAMILGGVNESTVPSSAMVRIADVVNSETDNIYEELAGGLTVANLLHGSANPIGGQSAVVKLRDGASPDELVFADAPAGIKFALGENVKQSNWGDRNTTRFPQSRMGVPTFMANRFMAGQRYLQALEDYKTNSGVPPRRNLELETIGEILQGKRWIHCHSYRQDEILMFLRTMENFGVKVGTLQHVLEGYKVADEIAKHGAGASTFADWWAYKFEVYDAIPFNGSLMRDRNVLVSFNSDSSDLARRMNLEAAKAVKFGSTTEQEALKFVTINPAKQLRIDHRVGSLEVGKDGDFVVWSKNPLDSTTVCLQTWIEGKQYFERTQAAERAKRLTDERTKLLTKAKSASKSSDTAKKDPAGEKKFFETAVEHYFDASERHCDDL